MKDFIHISTNTDYFVMPSLLQWELAPSVWGIGQKPNVRFSALFNKKNWLSVFQNGHKKINLDLFARSSQIHFSR
jgi:hypothetical protein